MLIISKTSIIKKLAKIFLKFYSLLIISNFNFFSLCRKTKGLNCVEMFYFSFKVKLDVRYFKSNYKQISR